MPSGRKSKRPARYFSDDEDVVVEAEVGDEVVDRVIEKLTRLGPASNLFNRIVEQVKNKILSEVQGSCSSSASSGSGERRDQGQVQNSTAVPVVQIPASAVKPCSISIPSFCGPEDAKTPSEYLEELSKYKKCTRFSDEIILSQILPVSLEGAAYRWFQFYGEFDSLLEFEKEFKNEFQAVGYSEELKKELDIRYQGPDESLTSFIQIIDGYFRRLGGQFSKVEKIVKVMDLMHPEYSLHMQGKVFTSLKGMSHEAHNVQERIKKMRDYRLPSSFEACLEPSLAWKPTSTLMLAGQTSSHVTPAVLPNLTLKYPAIDPFSFHHRPQAFQVNESQLFQRVRNDLPNVKDKGGGRDVT